ncbi:MAG: hypothetical protein K0S76_2280 [Herbinix sp.]|jgi:Zn finger protein HypA/HybF involved in hydrogenase expression|nr:hypothetical protein [Herbinix sp.]
MDVVGRYVAILLAVLIVVLFPLQYIAQSQSEAMDAAVRAYATEFADKARHQGEISLPMYEEFMQKLDATGELYNIAIETAHPVSGKELANSIAGSHIPTLTLRKASNFNTFPSDGIKSVGEELTSLAVHTHTPNCYAGHNHAASGCGPSLCDCGANTATLIKLGSEFGGFADGRWTCDGCGKVLIKVYRQWQSWVGDTYRLSIGVKESPDQLMIATYLQNSPDDKDIMAQTWYEIIYPESDTNKTFAELATLYEEIYTKAGIDLLSGYYVSPHQYYLLMYEARYSVTYNCTRTEETVHARDGEHSLEVRRYTDRNQNTINWYIEHNTYYTYFQYTCTTNIEGIYIDGDLWVKDAVAALFQYKDTDYIKKKIAVSKVIKSILPFVPDIDTRMGVTWKSMPTSCGITTEDTTPKCNQVVTSITAMKPIQTVDKGAAITTTATASYLDGHTGAVNCTSNYNPNQVGAQTVTLTYNGLVGNARTNGTRTCTVSVTVKETSLPQSLTVTPSATILYNGSEPTYTVKVNYANGTSKTLTSGFTKTGWTTGPGSKTVTFSYSENGKTVTASVTITVKPNISKITVIPSSSSLYNGSEPTYTVTLTYEDNTTKNITSGYTKTGWTTGPGSKTVTFSYTENGKTVTTNVTITVKPNVSAMVVVPSASTVYNGAEPTYTVTLSYENNATQKITAGYTKTGWTAGPGTKQVSFSYTENNLTVSTSTTITVLPNASGLTVTPAATTVYNGTEPVYTVKIHYEDGTFKMISSGYTKTGWTTGPGVKTVTFSYTENAKTVTTSTTITVKPNVTKISVIPSAATVYNGVEPTYTVTLTYEDNTSNILEAGYTKTGWTTGPGTKTVNFSYTENERTVTTSITITVLPNVSGLIVTPSATTVYNGTEPTYTVKVYYDNGTSKTITSGYTKTGWTTGPGTKTVIFSYMENGITKSANVIITVKPNLSSLTVTPTNQNTERYKQPVFTVRANYENGTNKVISSGYTVNGLNSASLGAQIVVISYKENNITKAASVTVVITRMLKTCSFCGSTYELDEYDRDNGCPVCKTVVTGIIVTPDHITVSKGEMLPITVEATYRSGDKAVITGWTSNYIPDLLGEQEVTITFQGKQYHIMVHVKDNKKMCPVCGSNYLLNPDGSDPGCPECKNTVTSITVNPRSITIEKHRELPITVMATFRDGHTQLVTGWSTDVTTDIAGTFAATIYYKSAQDHIQVTILEDDLINCPYCGLHYSFYEHPQGCPVCYYTIIGMEASLRNGGSRVLYNSDLNLQLSLFFQDTHRQMIFTGWTINGYQPNKIGIQTIFVLYQELSTLLTIEVVKGPHKIICPNGHEYYLNEDGTDAGCPYCTSDMDNEEAVFYYNMTYTEDIIETIYTQGTYYLKQGDYLTITIIPGNVSMRTKLMNMFFGTNRDYKKTYSYGGEVI